MTSGIQPKVGRRSNLFIGGSKQVSFGVLEVEQEKTRKKWLRRGFIFPCILRIALFVVAK